MVAGWKASLARNLLKRYEALQLPEDLEQAEQIIGCAIKAASENSIELIYRLNVLSSILQRRFERYGRTEDLDEAVRVTRKSLQIYPPGNAKDCNISDLGESSARGPFRWFYDSTAYYNLADVIRPMEARSNATPEQNRDTASLLSNLSNRLAGQYEQIGRLKDLEDAITASRRAISILSEHDDSISFTLALGNLGNQLQRRFIRSGKIEDLREAIQATRRARNLAHDGGSLKVLMQNNLGLGLLKLYENSGDIANLEEAIDITSKAIESTSKGTLEMMNFQINLSNQLYARFNYNGQLTDLENAIKEARSAVDNTSEYSWYRATWLQILGRNLAIRAKVLNQPDDYAESMELYIRAFKSPNGIPMHRIEAAIILVQLLKRSRDFQQAYEIARDALQLLPTINLRVLSHTDQLNVSATYAGLAADACALYLECYGGEPESAECALKILEAGRGSLLNMSLEGQADISNLRVEYPDYASQLEGLRAMISMQSQPLSECSFADVDAHISPTKLVQDYNTCIKNIQALNGFADFMQPASQGDMRRAATGGAIVVVNVSDVRSDALLITTTSTRALNLKRLAYNDLRSKLVLLNPNMDASQEGVQNSKYRKFLKWLWTRCVKPILRELSYGTKTSADALPRIWRVGADIASSLPFHATGDHYRDSTQTAMNVAVSSYAPTVRTLVYAKRRRRVGRLQYNGSLVSMPSTPDEISLAGVLDEMEAVKNTLASLIQCKSVVQPTARALLDQITSADILHFAGHGISNAGNPLESGLILQTLESNSGEMIKDYLTVGKLLETRMQPAILAFLSACSTAQNQNERLADKSIHLASGFVVAGYRHVIACLWPSNDLVCRDIAKEFYLQLSPFGIDITNNDEGFARALHASINTIYVQAWKKPLVWAPYIHMGA